MKEEVIYTARRQAQENSKCKNVNYRRSFNKIIIIIIVVGVVILVVVQYDYIPN